DSYVSNKTRERGFTFPLYLYPLAGQNHLGVEEHRQANVNPKVIEHYQALGLSWRDEGFGDGDEIFGPDDIYGYVYAVLHSPTYRSRFFENLKRSLPR